ncbi:hypothetical protein ABGB19_24175 [Mycobacterium sp. B14F4]|uniref:hypothetical protein n=1 Tax=Mycobacterium sp. B14F4 TaxID=3153565 RepID=UPI00325E5DC9
MRAKGGTRQFEVLTEPQESAEKPPAVNGGRSSRSRGAHRKPAASRQTKVWAGLLVAVAVAVTVGLLLLLRSDPAPRRDAPVRPIPATATSPAATATTSPPAPATTSEPLPPPATTPAGDATPPVVRSAPPAAPTTVPTTVADEPEAEVPPPPATRAPISVAPETRPPFPNQTPPTGGDARGGLLGGGGLL